jgi:hypothetical protein
MSPIVVHMSSYVKLRIKSTVDHYFQLYYVWITSRRLRINYPNARQRCFGIFFVNLDHDNKQEAFQG